MIEGFFYAWKKGHNMATGYLLVDAPNPYTPQGGYPRRGVSRPSGTCIVHTSEGPWQNGVDSLTSFVRTRTDYGCYHRAWDWADIAHYYPWEWETWQDSETNPWAVGIAAACRTSDWAIMPADIREGYYRNGARVAADFVTYMRDTHGVHVPLRRLTGAEARARVPGFCAHGDSGVSRSDPGADFDWAYFFHCTQEVLGGASISPASGNITPAPQPLDPMEEIMSYYKDRADFEGWQRRMIREEVTALLPDIADAVLDEKRPLKGSHAGKDSDLGARISWMPHEQHRAIERLDAILDILKPEAKEQP